MIRILLKKDILLKVKNPVGFLVLMALPLVFTFMMGAIFSSSDKEVKLPVIHLLVEDHDSSVFSEFLLGSFRNGQMAEMFDLRTVGKDSGRALMDDGKASALLIIPKGFQDSLLNQQHTELVLVKNPSEAFLPKITEEVVHVLAEGTDRLFRVANQQFGPLDQFSEMKEWPKPAQVAYYYVQFKSLYEGLKSYLFPLLIDIKTETIKNADEKPVNAGNQTFAYVLAGIAAMTIFFVLETLGRDYFRERDNKTLYRITASPAGINQYILSKQCFLLVMGMLAFFIVWIIGVVIFGIRIQSGDLFGFVLIAVLLIGALTGIIGALFGIAKNRNISSSINPAFIIFFSILGGGMVPLQVLPVFMKKLAVISPLFWGIDGMQKVLIEHKTILQVGSHVLVLGILLLVFNGLAFVLFRRRLQP